MISDINSNININNLSNNKENEFNEDGDLFLNFLNNINHSENTGSYNNKKQNFKVLTDQRPLENNLSEFFVVSNKPKKTKKSWTPEDSVTLKRLYEEGTTLTQITKIMNRSIGTIQTKVKLLEQGVEGDIKIQWGEDTIQVLTEAVKENTDEGVINWPQVEKKVGLPFKMCYEKWAFMKNGKAPYAKASTVFHDQFGPKEVSFKEDVAIKKIRKQSKLRNRKTPIKVQPQEIKAVKQSSFSQQEGLQLLDELNSNWGEKTEK